LSSSSLLGDGGELAFEHVGNEIDLGADFVLAGLGEDRADRRGDHLVVALLTFASTLRMKWTRQRCQLAPCITVATAFTRPRWASLMTSWTPPRPRSRRSRRNSVQNVSVSLSPVAQPSTSRLPSALTPVAMTTAWDTTRSLRRTLQ